MWFGRENDENVVWFGLEIDVVGLPPLAQLPCLARQSLSILSK